MKHAACLLGLLAVMGAPRALADSGIGALEQQVFGTRYESRPIEERVSRLEQALHTRTPQGSSIGYRIAQLFAAQKGQAEKQQHALAIQFYNRAVDLSAQGKTDEATAAYRQAIQADSGLVEAYNNLANLLLQQHQYDETVLLYKEGLERRPDEALLHRNLGVLYEKLGKVPAAVAEYQRYLTLARKPDPPIEQIVETYYKYRRTGLGSPDYVAAATEASKGQALLWPEKTNPIRVYIMQEKADQRFVTGIIQKALGAWKKATGERLQFLVVDDPEAANIKIRLTEGPLSDPDKDIGHTEYTMPEDQLFRHRMNQVGITLNTGNTASRSALPADSVQAQIYRMALHELGHAIGIWGHSPDPGDIMFTHPIAPELSTRDVNTIRKLYGL